MYQVGAVSHERHYSSAVWQALARKRFEAVSPGCSILSDTVPRRFAQVWRIFRLKTVHRARGPARLAGGKSLFGVGGDRGPERGEGTNTLHQQSNSRGSEEHVGDAAEIDVGQQSIQIHTQESAGQNDRTTQQ